MPYPGELSLEEISQLIEGLKAGESIKIYNTYVGPAGVTIYVRYLTPGSGFSTRRTRHQDAMLRYSVIFPDPDEEPYQMHALLSCSHIFTNYWFAYACLVRLKGTPNEVPG